jgi:hypothetical protein
MGASSKDDRSNLGWTEVQLREVHSRLRRTQEGRIARLLEEDQWVTCNLLLDEGVDAQAVSARVGTSTEVVVELQGARRCLDLYGGDTDALRRCLQGGLE